MSSDSLPSINSFHLSTLYLASILIAYRKISFKNCMIRIPASFNCKDGTKQEEVRIVQRWDGVRPSIKPLLFRFDLYLLFSKSNELHKNKRKRYYYYEPKIFSTAWRTKAKAQGLVGEMTNIK